MSLSMAEQRKQADHQKKRPRSSEGAESSSRGGGKKSSAIVVAAAGPVVTKTPVLVAPSPFASKPPPTAASPIASKPPALAASSTTPKGAASSPVASTPLALAAPPSPVASTPASSIPLAIMAPSSAPTIVKPGGAERSVLEGDEQAATGAMVVAEEEVFLPVKKKWLHCAVCSAPLKPPIFTCEDRHFVCSACGGGGGGGGPNEYKYCGACHRAASFVHSSGMDGLVDDTKVPCPHAKFGCERSIAYHETPDHTARCAHAPCYCLDPDCSFEGDPAGLVRHLTEDSGRHRWPVVKIKYETSYAFVVLVPSPPELHRRLLVAEEDGGVFLLAVGTAAATHADDFCPVTVVCVRGNDDAARPLYMCTLWVNGPPAPASRFSDSFRLKAEVSSCAVPSEVDMKRSRLLALVIPTMLHGKNKKLHLRVSIVRIP